MIMETVACGAAIGRTVRASVTRLWLVGRGRGEETLARDRGACIALALFIGLTIAGGAQVRAAARHDPEPRSALRQPVVIDAAVSKVDYQSDTATFEDIVVVQGDTRITADRARAAGLDFKRSLWTFDGHVLISLPPRGTLSSDRAIVQIRNDRVDRATATGDPAQFERPGTQSQAPLTGHADRIVYQATERTVRLSGDAWLSDGRNEITGPVLVYDLRQDTVQGASSGNSRSVRIRIVPPAPAKEPEREGPSRPGAHGEPSRSAPVKRREPLALPSRPSIR
jgi:lipopolysaccharide transport protein LptA